MKNFSVSLVFICCTLLASAQKINTAKSQYICRGDTICQALSGIRHPGPHLWRRSLWWNSANIFEALLDHDRLTGHSSAKLCKHLYAANYLRFGRGFKNWAFDDEAWWAMAWLKAYDQTGEKKYLKIPEGIFADMAAKAWQDKCGGGCHWMRHKPYKNAITNELFIALAANLARRHNNDSTLRKYYLDWAIKGSQWLAQSGMRNDSALYNDGLDDSCRNNNGWTWSYNQGVILGGLKEIYLLTGDERYLLSAKQTALSAIEHLSDKGGILTDPCGLGLTVNSVQFKGIFIRYLSELNVILKDDLISGYILHNADGIWNNAQDGKHRFDGFWAGPYKKWWGGATGVALDLMNAAQMQEAMGK